jgi:alkanesulfonate monooxygenase SsuD/methylene tetrahydromethanopterin reductase-like flavin-dependent oxidoreductase (luciferase family)
MEYFVNYPVGGGVGPGDWASGKEAEGWHGICASDHLWVGPTRYPQVFVAATQMACATSSVKITTSFCNNLFRSPVEFAQAALSLQAASRGRFEAGLGAGWAQDEMDAMGEPYPEPGVRVSRYVEALRIASSLLAS